MEEKKSIVGGGEGRRGKEREYRKTGVCKKKDIQKCGGKLKCVQKMF